jgi:Ca-activated chloride channel family protein
MVFRFENSLFLYGLALIPLMVFIFLLVLKWRRKSLNKIAEAGLQSIVLPQLSKSKVVWRFIFWCLAIAF